MQQSTIFEAIAERDIGIERVTRKANKTSPGWTDAYYAFIRLYARNHSKPDDRYSGEDIRAEYERRGMIPPHDWRAAGGPMKRAAREGLIVDTGVRAPRRSGHGTAGAVVYVTGRA